METKAPIVFKRIVNAIVMVACLLTVSSCNNEDYFAKEKEKPQVAYHRVIDSTHVEFVDSKGVPIERRTLTQYGRLFAEAPLYKDAIYPWQKAEKETLQRDVTTNEQEHKFNFNYGVNTIKSAIALVDYDGRLIPRWPEDQVTTKAKSISIKETTQNGLYYAETTVVYGLCYERKEAGKIIEIDLDQVTQPLIAQEGFKDQFLGIKVVRQVHKFNSGVWDPETEILTCTDTVFYTEQWKSGFKNESWVLVHPQNKIKVSESGNIVDDLSKVIGKSWTNASANLNGYRITETWESKSLRESKVEIEANGQIFDIVDSIHICRWNPDGGIVEAANKIRLNFAREGMPVDKAYGYKTVNIQQKDIKEVKFLISKHWKFPAEADVDTTNKTFSVDHMDRAWFNLIYNDNTNGKDSILYDVNHLFDYIVVSYVPAELKGQTVNVVNGTVTYNGKVVLTITLKSRTVKNLTYRGKDYTDKAAACDLTPKKAFFGENEITVTLSHDSENVTGKIPATYNTVTGYKLKGSPVHLSWNAVTGTYELTCKNLVTVVEILKDGSEGKTYDLPYTSYNNWSKSGQIGGEITQSQLDAIIGVPVAFDATGKVTLLDSSMTLTHSMHADKVTKGDFSYQPAPCEAVAKYLTPISATQGRVDVYHEGQKITDFMVSLGFTVKEEPYTFDGKLNHMWCTMALIDGSNGVATIDGLYLMGDVTKDGITKVYGKKVGTITNDGQITLNYNRDSAWDSVTLDPEDPAQANRISANHPLAFTGKTPKAKWGYINLDEVHLISNGNYEITYYNLLTGAESRNVCSSGSTIDSKYPYPVVGTWANGKIVIAGETIYINGSQN